MKDCWPFALMFYAAALNGITTQDIGPLAWLTGMLLIISSVIYGYEWRRSKRMTTPPNDTPTPRTSEILGLISNWERTRAGRGAEVLWTQFKEEIQKLERELAEAKAANLTRDQACCVLDHCRELVGVPPGGELIPTLKSIITERDTARAEAQKWRECAEYAWTVIANAGGGDWTKEHPDWQEAAANWRDNSYHKALNLCHSPTLSSPPLQQQSLPEDAAHALEASLRNKYGSQRVDIALENVARVGEMALQLAAHESKLELLLRRTDWLLEHFSLLVKEQIASLESFKTEWPDDLALTESTSISPPTKKPESSGDAK